MARHLWVERRRFGLTLLLMMVGAVLEGAGVGLLIPFLDSLLSPESTPWASGVAWVDRWLLATHAPALERLYRTAGLILAVVWMSAGLNVLAGYVNIWMRESILHRIRCDVVTQLHSIALSFFSKTRSGTLINTMTTETQRLRELINVASQVLVQVFMLSAYAAAIVWISWQLSLIALVLCVGVFVAMNVFLRKLRSNGRAIKDSNGRIASVVTELIGGVRTITEFGTKDFEARRFGAVSEEARDVIAQAGTRGAVVAPSTQGLASTALVVMVIVAVQFLVLPGHMSTAALLAFMVALLRLLPILKTINGLRAVWSVYASALDDIANLLRTDDKPYLRSGHRDLPGFSDAIQLRNVSFGYTPDQTVIDDVSLTIPHGHITAIVGGSGAGKSTLADLVARFYDPDAGVIELDGVDVRDYRIDALRNTIAVVNQNTFLFNDTVRNNITYGLDGITDAQVREVARKANALEFIEAMPNGFEEQLGDRGARISGGQRQRIAIARALLRDPDILILDEATSALDSVSEKLVQDSMEYLMRGRTVIIIAHRLSTVENADNVVVMEDGRVVEEGPYHELLERKGQLWEYHSLQFQMAE